MKTRSFVRSCGLFVLGGFVLLGAGCGRGTTSADPSAVTPPSAGAPSGSVAQEGVATGGQPSAPSVARGACDHPYYPLRLGYEIRYRTEFPSMQEVSSGGYTLRVTEATAATAKLRATFSSAQSGELPLTSEQVFNCASGGVTATSYLDLGSSVPGGAAQNQFRATTRAATGEMLPAEMRIGSSWRNGFDIRMESVASGEPGLLSQPIDLTVSIERRVVARERVRVPAGEYDALKVTAVTDLGMGSAMQGTEWWVEGVGMVKSVYDLGSGAGSNVTEAVSVTVPR